MIGPKVAKPTKSEEQEAYRMVEERDGGLCVRCRRNTYAVNREHRRPRGVGGLTVVENLQLLCGSGTIGCHGWKTNNPAAALAEGYSVPGFVKDSSTWPARRWMPTSVGTLRLSWVIYNRLGGVEQISAAEAERMRQVAA